MVFVSISGSKSTDNLLKEKSPKITIATNTRAVDTGFLTAVPYKLLFVFDFNFHTVRQAALPGDNHLVAILHSGYDLIFITHTAS